MGEAKFTAIHACVYIILLNIHEGIGLQARRCITVVLWPRLLTFVSLARHTASCSTALPKVFSRHLQVYQCIRTHKSQHEYMWVANLWTTPVHVHITNSCCSHSASPFLATGLFHYRSLIGDIDKCIGQQ